MSDRLELDHLVVVARTLAEGVEHVYQQLGIHIPVGGKHPFMGTHNHIMQLGNRAFLEVIAIDPEATKPAHPRWFDLDIFGNGPPQLKMWVARSKNLSATKPHIPKKYQRSIPMSRPTANGLMEWEITVPEDGSLPFDGAFPTILQWPLGPLPIENMQNLGCELLNFEIGHPESKKIDAMLQPIFEDKRVKFVEFQEPQLKAEIQTPLGLKTLS